MDRRKFLENIAVIGAGSLLLPATAQAAGKKQGRKKSRKGGPQGFDENLVCIVSDTHIKPGSYQADYFENTVKDILALNPLPANVICLGDIAYHTGKPEEYELAKKLFAPLEKAGMKLTFAMGNHDRRQNFAEYFPDYAAKSELPHRLVFTVETPRADFIILDSLQESEDPGKWITEGATDEEQKEWLREKVARHGDKPFFVMAHHDIKETGVTKIIMANTACRGYIHGHRHKWFTDWARANYRDRNLIRCLCVPSTGHWGDIGFTLIELGRDRAVASNQYREFFFPYPLKPGERRPEMWEVLEEEHRDAKCIFPYR
ncbi:MAG: metallophosphoesterase [Bacteroidales bacterium]|nr:metallophosphoesterase [Bacteroidales bacterium]